MLVEATNLVSIVNMHDFAAIEHVDYLKRD
jgi:hypothetical protein